MFAKQNKKLGILSAKLKAEFPKEDLYYHFLEDEFGLEKVNNSREEYVYQSVSFMPSEVTNHSISMSNYNSNKSQTLLQNEGFKSNWQTLKDLLIQIKTYFGNEKNVSKYKFKNFKLLRRELQDNHDYFAKHTNNTMQMSKD